MKDYYIVHFIFQTASYYCNENKINLNEEITEYNLNNLFKWVSDNTTEIDCNYMLDIWNIISDIAHSLNQSFYGDNNNVDSNWIHEAKNWKYDRRREKIR